MLKTKGELQDQAKKENIKFYPVHNCSMCGYGCGYCIYDDIVTYDSGCNCSYGGENKRSWDNLTECYNRNQPENNPQIKEEFLVELNKTWKF